MDQVKEREKRYPARLAVGISGLASKPFVAQLRRSGQKRDQPLHFICRSDTLGRLLADLAVHRVDLVIAGIPHSPRFLCQNTQRRHRFDSQGNGEHLLTAERLLCSIPNFSRVFHHRHTGRFERLHLFGRRALAA
jgi:hypothetical protein